MSATSERRSSPDDVTLRAALASDEHAIGRLGALLVQLHHTYDPQRFIAATPQTECGYGEYLASQITKPKMIVTVAERGGDVIGYAWAGIEGYDYMALRGPAGVLYDIVVDPAHRGQGVGQRLLDQMLVTLAKRDAPRVVLSTAARNESAQRLFARAGFRQTMIEMTRESNVDSR
jgi:ribosomal protein S18 acetylase RimI-like enzyme